MQEKRRRFRDAMKLSLLRRPQMRSFDMTSYALVFNILGRKFVLGFPSVKRPQTFNIKDAWKNENPNCEGQKV